LAVARWRDYCFDYLSYGAMEGLVSMSKCRKNVFFSVFIAASSVGHVFASQSSELLVTMETGKCDPEAAQLHKIALAGDALGQLAFGQAASKNLCGAAELGKEPSFYWFRKSAEQGNDIAQVALGKHLSTSWSGKDEEESFTWYQRAADQGNADAKFGLAQLYLRGSYSKKIPRNDELALKLYHEAAAQGHKVSYIALSQIYEDGSNGVEKNNEIAAYWYRKAADNGSAFAQWRLAKMLQEGLGVDQSDAEARLWYGKSAGQGNLFAQTSLAIMHRDGVGGPPDEKLALQLFLESAHAGEHNAQFEVGRIYLLGLHGVPQSQKEAESWFNKSNERRRPVSIKEFEGLR